MRSSQRVMWIILRKSTTILLLHMNHFDLWSTQVLSGIIRSTSHKTWRWDRLYLLCSVNVYYPVILWLLNFAPEITGEFLCNELYLTKPRNLSALGQCKAKGQSTSQWWRLCVDQRVQSTVASRTFEALSDLVSAGQSQFGFANVGSPQISVCRLKNATNGHRERRLWKHRRSRWITFRRRVDESTPIRQYASTK